MRSARVVVTGAGAVSPLGLTVSDLWEGLKTGRCGIDTIGAFDPVGFSCPLAGEVPPYKLRNHLPKSSRKAAKLMSRDIELAVVAADEAFRSSGLVTRAIDPEQVTLNPQRTAINLGAGLISCDLVELAPAVAASCVEGRFDLRQWGRQGIENVTPLWLLKYLPNMLACHISLLHDIQGPSNTITCAETSGHLSVIEAVRIIQREASDVALAGGAEAKVNPVLMARQCLIGRATEARQDAPHSACRPFDSQAAGSVFGEAAGIMVLENRECAEKRGAPLLAEIAGYGQSNCINSPYERLEPEGTGIRIAIEKALAHARITPADLDLVIPHGTGIPHDDLAEARAIQNTLGTRVPIFPSKSMLSNTGAAAGALDLIVALSALREGFIPAARNCDQRAEGIRLNIQSAAQTRPIRYALSCSYSYGGQTAAVILKNPHLEAIG